jgi:hypothetical protein
VTASVEVAHFKLEKWLERVATELDDVTEVEVSFVGSGGCFGVQTGDFRRGLPFSKQ